MLLNGRRIVGEAGSSVDINMLPLSAIERVGVLTDGASAIYGSGRGGGCRSTSSRRRIPRPGGLEL